MKREIPRTFQLAMKAKYHRGVRRVRRAADGGVEFEAMTYRDLAAKLAGLTDAQLDQPVQLFKDGGNHSKPVLLMPAYDLGTVEEMCHVGGEVARETRGPDFAHHPEQVILLIDGPPFSDEGDTAFTLEDGGMRGNVTGKLFSHGGNRAAVSEPPSWEVYGRMAYVKWRLFDGRNTSLTYDRASEEWPRLNQSERDVWVKIAKQAAVSAYPTLAGREDADPGE